MPLAFCKLNGIYMPDYLDDNIQQATVRIYTNHGRDAAGWHRNNTDWSYKLVIHLQRVFLVNVFGMYRYRQSKTGADIDIYTVHGPKNSLSKLTLDWIKVALYLPMEA